MSRIIFSIALVLALAFVLTNGAVACRKPHRQIVHRNGHTLSCKRVIRHGDLYLEDCFYVR